MAANVLSVLIPTLISTIQETARATGFVFNGVTRDQNTEAAAQGQSVTLPELPEITAGTVTPGTDPTEGGGTTATAKTLSLTEHKKGVFKVTAEEERGMAALGGNYRSESIQLAVASVIEGASAYLADLMTLGAGSAFGTPGTDPFATTPNILADIAKDFADLKCPDMGRLGILSTTDYASASKLTQFQKLNEAPPGTSFAAGRLGMLSNFNVGYDQAAGRTQTTVAAGGYLINNGAGYAAGIRALEVDTGSGSFAAGDVVTIAGNVLPGTATLAKMVVESFVGTTLTLTQGLYAAVADAAAVVRIATHFNSLFAHPMATYFSMRPSAEVSGGDKATIRQIVRDPVTGIALRLAYYPMYHQGQWEVSGVYGGKVRRPSWLKRLIR
jgi:hypothetical protein